MQMSWVSLRVVGVEGQHPQCWKWHIPQIQAQHWRQGFGKGRGKEELCSWRKPRVRAKLGWSPSLTPGEQKAFILIQLMWPRAAMQPVPGDKTHRTTEKFCFELMQAFLREFMEKREVLTWQKGTEASLLSTKLSRFPVLFLNKQTQEFLMKSLHLTSKYCTKTIDTNVSGVLFTYEHSLCSWVGRVHSPDMPDLIIKGITSTTFGEQSNTCTCLPKWSKIHVPPSCPSHQSGEGKVTMRAQQAQPAGEPAQPPGWAPSVGVLNMSTSPLCQGCHVSTAWLPWEQGSVHKSFVTV